MTYLLHHLLEKSTKNTPKKTAVIFKENKITYSELNGLSNRIAHLLIKRGIKKGDRVAIFVPKSIYSIAAIFGILKAGAVYVPIDINSPSGRFQYIIKNCNVKCIFTLKLNSKNLLELSEINSQLKTVITFESKKDVSDLKFENVDILTFEDINEKNNSDENPDINIIPQDLAYILYTSGSTGNPKGVMITHLSSFSFVQWCFETFKLNSEDVVSNHAPFHFDLSVLDIYTTFMVGATLAPVPEELSFFPYSLAEWIENTKISVWYSVPSILSMLVQKGGLERFEFNSLRFIIFAGEVFPTKFLISLMKQINHPEYYNLFGPTETNVITYYKVPGIPKNPNQPISIGKACENAELLVLDEKGNMVNEVGVKGELYARGLNVAKGYWGDKDKTKKVFLKNFKQPNFEEVLYKTNDIVSYNKDGNFTFHGRSDHMIKSRGYRIELGEIESALLSNELISEAVAIPVPDENITNRIKVILVVKDGQRMEKNQIQSFCAGKLPKYMIPEIVEFRNSLPKTANGKIDRNQLSKI